MDLCFSKVRNVSKLLHVLNGVYVGQYHIFTKVARFDRHMVQEVRKESEKKDSINEGRYVVVHEGEKMIEGGKFGEVRKVEGEKRENVGKKVEEGGSKSVVRKVREEGEVEEGVRVEEVLVRLDGGEEETSNETNG